jgi:hypothetical protein
MPVQNLLSGKKPDKTRVKLKSNIRKATALFAAPLGTKGSTEFTLEHSTQANPEATAN